MNGRSRYIRRVRGMHQRDALLLRQWQQHLRQEHERAERRLRAWVGRWHPRGGASC